MQLQFTGPLLSTSQIKTATGSCTPSCTPSNTNDLTVTICCLGQNNCNNVFGYGGHHHNGHSGEKGVKNTRTGKAQSQGKGPATKKTTKATTKKAGNGRFAIDLD